MINDKNDNGIIEDDIEDLEIVKHMKKIKCKVLLEGYKQTEMDFYFCSCDPHQKDPICEECAIHCHSGHVLSVVYHGVQVCQCGIKCHRIESKTLHEQIYDPRCYYHELAIYSNLNIYYEDDNRRKICLFCYNFCYQDMGFVKKYVEGKEEVPECECEGHNEIKFIFHSTNELAIYLKIENLNSTHLLNVLFMCEKSFKNIYSTFSLFINQLKIDILEPEFEFDSTIQLSNSFWALSNFASFANLTWDFNYFSEKVRSFFEIDFTYNLLETKFNDDSLAVWIFKNNFICCFEKITLGYDFVALPRFKISDFQNFTPFQRLIFTSNIKGFESIMEKYILRDKMNIIDKLLQALTMLNKSKFTKVVGYEILFRLLSILKILAKFYLFTNEHKLRYCLIIDEIFKKFDEFHKSNNVDEKNKSSVKGKEFQTLETIIKTLLYFSFHYNDHIILKNINGEIDRHNVKFFHSKNELGKYISKNCINILNYINNDLNNDFILEQKNIKENKKEHSIISESSNESKDSVDEINEKSSDQKIKESVKIEKPIEENPEINKDKKSSLKKILTYSTQIMSLCLNNNDFYLVGLRRNTNVITNELNLKSIQGNFSQFERLFLKFLETEFLDLEQFIYLYFNFEIKFEKLVEKVESLVVNFFNYIDLSEFNFSGNNTTYKNKNINKSNRNQKNNKQASNSLNYNLVKNEENKNLQQENLDDFEIKGTFDEKYLKLQKYRVLINQSPLLFSLIKVLNILYEMEYEKRESNLELRLISSILRILFFYIEENPDNCMVVLSKQILSVLCEADHTYIEKILSLAYCCLKCICYHKFEVVSSLKWIEYLLAGFLKLLDVESNSLSSILKFLKVIKKISLDIPTLFHSLLINNVRENLAIIYRKCPCLKEYKNYIIEIGREIYEKEFEKEEYNCFKDLIALDINKKEKNLTNLELKSKIFLKYITILNNCFDDNALFNDNNFLTSVFTCDEIKFFLRNNNLNLNLRTQMLRFYRMVYIDVPISHEHISDYRSEFCINPENDYKTLKVNDDLKIFVFLERLMKISTPSLNSEHEYEILSHEMKNFEEIVEKSTQKISKVCIDYLENGLILPLRVYFNKIFSIAYSMSGNDFLKIYELTYLILYLKKFLLENRDLSKLVETEQDTDIFKKISYMNQTCNVIIWKKLNAEALVELNTDIDKITDISFQALDYVAVYNVVWKHFFSYIYKPKSKSLVSSFSKKLSFDENQIKLYEDSLVLREEKRLFQLIINYEQCKLDFMNGALVENLSDIHIQYDKNYRHLLINFLFFISKNSKFFDESVSKNSNTIILKLLQYDTVQVQNEIMEIYKTDKNRINLNFLVDYFFKHLISVIFISYNPSNISFGDDYHISCTVIKIFKYLCEEHNKEFQKVFLCDLFFIYTENNIPDMNYRKSSNNFDFFSDNMMNIIGEKVEKKIMFFDMMLLILNKILLLSGWEKVNADEDNNINYFYDLFSCIIELLVETIQGTDKDNFNSLYKETVKDIEKEDNEINSETVEGDQMIRVLPTFLNNIKLILFRDVPNSNTIYNVRKDLVNFLLAFLEEKACPNNIKYLIISTYYPKTILGSIVNTLKKYHIRKNFETGKPIEEMENDDEGYGFVDGAYEDLSKKNSKFKSKNYKNIKINEKLYKFLIDKYFSDEEFSNSPEFEFANTLYRYLKLLASEFNNDEAKNLIDSANNFKSGEVSRETDESEVNFNDKFIENYYTINFFEEITKSIMIQIENNITRVIFTLNPLIFYLSSNTRDEFLETVNRGTRYSKLFSLIESTDYFYDEIIHNYRNSRNNLMLRMSNQINYFWVSFAIFIYVLGINIFMICVLTIDDIRNGQSSFNSYFLAIAFIQIITTAVFVFIWIYSKFPLYYLRDKKRYLSKNMIEEDKLTNFNKIAIIFSGNVLNRKEINGLIWCLIFGIAAVSSPNNYFLYSISLLSVISLSVTLNNIILAIKLRWKQLLSTAIFVIVIIYCYACIAFFFLNDYFVTVINGVNDNQCQTLKYCFLTHLLYGLRKHGGIGDIMGHVNLEHHPSQFMARFFFDFLFFIMILIILLNIVFGIIIDTFRELRIEHQKEDYDKMNVCFICGVERDELEKESINYIHHINEEHNVWNYAYYMIGLKFVDIQDANAINSYAKEKIEKREISWIPAQKTHKREEVDKH